MGYTTEFRGEFELDKSLTEEHKEYLEAFANTRRMQRDPDIASTLEDPIRKRAKLPIGEEGEYFVGGRGYMGQDDDRSVTSHNMPPTTQPSLWCQWIPNEDGTAIVWDEGEKFYSYVEWIEYIIDHFLIPWGYSLTGEVEWRGEEWSDIGRIIIENNEVFSTSN